MSQSYHPFINMNRLLCHFSVHKVWYWCNINFCGDLIESFEIPMWLVIFSFTNTVCDGTQIEVRLNISHSVNLEWAITTIWFIKSIKTFISDLLRYLIHKNILYKFRTVSFLVTITLLLHQPYHTVCNILTHLNEVSSHPTLLSLVRKKWKKYGLSNDICKERNQLHYPNNVFSNKLVTLYKQNIGISKFLTQLACIRT